MQFLTDSFFIILINKRIMLINAICDFKRKILTNILFNLKSNKIKDKIFNKKGGILAIPPFYSNCTLYNKIIDDPYNFYI